MLTNTLALQHRLYNIYSRIKGFPGGLHSKRIHLQCRSPGFYPWVGQIPWRRAWQPTLVFLPAWKIPMDRGAWQATVHGVTESDMIEQVSTHTHTHIPEYNQQYKRLKVNSSGHWWINYPSKISHPLKNHSEDSLKKVTKSKFQKK